MRRIAVLYGQASTGVNGVQKQIAYGGQIHLAVRQVSGNSLPAGIVESSAVDISRTFMAASVVLNAQRQATEQPEPMILLMGGSSVNATVGLTKLGCSAALGTCIPDAVSGYCLDQLDAYRMCRGYVRKVRGEGRTSLAVADARTASFLR